MKPRLVGPDGKPFKHQPGRPYLRLCKPCNRRAADAGDKAATEGVMVCAACAAAVDQWTRDAKVWAARRARNKRKARWRKRR